MRRLSIAAAVLALAATGCGDSRTASGSPNDCAACHAFPPATLAHASAPGGTWEAGDCSQCHPTSVDPTGAIVPGGTHANGSVEGGHALPFTDPSLHGPMANAGIALCQACHGPTLTGGTPGTTGCDGCHAATSANWRTDCTFCHGDSARAATPDELAKSAPPLDVRDTGELAGSSDTTELGVGAHVAHVVDAAYGCLTCHETLPTDLFSAGHIDGANGSIELGELAVTGGRTPTWNRTAAACSSTWCHDRGGSAPIPTWTVAGAMDCGSCHPAEPTAAAHPAHVAPGKTFSDGFSCGTCHPGAGTYPNDHLDGSLDVVFDNAPVAGGTYAAGTCSSVYCHGTFAGGTNASIAWTGTVACGDCHPNPPITGKHTDHVDTFALSCGACHTGYTATAVDTGLHVNGTIDVPRLPTTACHPIDGGSSYGLSCDGRSDW